MDITLQYSDDCPNWTITKRHLQTLIDDQALDATVHYQLIDTPEAAIEHGFRGSPTVLIDGHDPFAEPHDPIGLSCRVYVVENGLAGSPTLDQLKRAIVAARADERRPETIRSPANIGLNPAQLPRSSTGRPAAPTGPFLSARR